MNDLIRLERELDWLAELNNMSRNRLAECTKELDNFKTEMQDEIL